MTPVERGAKRLLARRGIARSADQDGERIVQALGQLLGAEQRRVRGGKLESERNPFETRARLRDRHGVVLAEHEPRVALAAAIGKQLNRRRPLNARKIEPIPRAWKRERADDESLLA